MATKEFFAKIKRWGESTLEVRRRAVKAALIDRWLDLTGSLRSTLPAYQAAMDVREEGDALVFVVGDNPRIAKMVELGATPWDLRDTVLRGPNVRVSRKGTKFVAVPFGRTSRQIRAWGGSAVERMARNLKPYPGPGAERLPPGLAEKLDPYHVTDPLDAVVRKARIPPGRGPAYMTWRTISENSRPWIHPGIKSRNFMRQVLEYEAEDIARKALEALDK
jgi:hypothetical protein